MSHLNNIEHKGIIEGIDNQSIYVKILAHSACGGCQAKGICNLSEVEHKIIEVKKTNNEVYQIGDEVTVTLQRSLGFRAVLLGYLVPFIILMFVLVLSLSLFKNELAAGLISIIILGPYYAILYHYKDKLKKTFEFTLK